MTEMVPDSMNSGALRAPTPSQNHANGTCDHLNKTKARHVHRDGRTECDGREWHGGREGVWSDRRTTRFSKTMAKVA